MTTQIKRRRGTTTEHSTFTGAEGELTIDTTKDTVVVHDGSTAGGHPLAKESSLAGKVDTSGDTMTGPLDVQSTITADGLTVNGSAQISGVANANLQLQSTGGNIYQVRTDTNDLFMYNGITAKPLAKFSYGGDISFYEDTGTTPKFFWDASAESLGIGTSSPSSYHSPADNLVIGSSGDNGLTIVSGTTSGGTICFADGTSGGAQYAGFIDYQHNGDYMRFGTNVGTERMRIDSSGNVGIGTGSPSVKLDISGGNVKITNASNSKLEFRTSGNNSTSELLLEATSSTGTTDQTASIKAVGSGSTELGVNLTFEVKDRFGVQSERMRIDSSGRVGIGMSPTGALSIRPSGTGSEDTHFGFGANLDAYITTGSNGNMIFREGNGAGANTERMRIDSNGNVGIGTSSPSAKLDVVSSGTTSETIAEFGNANISDGLSIETNGNLEWGFNTKNSRSMTFSTNQTERMRIDSNGNVGIGTSSPDAQLDIESATQAVLRLNHTGSNYWELQNDSNLKFSRGGTERMRIASNGNVGIGTSSPSSRLHVEQAADGNGMRLSYATRGSGHVKFHLTGVTNDGYSLTHHNGTNENTLNYVTRTLHTWNINNSEAMRIDSSGNLLVRTTGVPNGTSSYGSGFVGEANSRSVLYCAGSTTAQVSVARFYNPNGQVGEIKTQSASTLYVTSSDYRLKTDAQPMTGASARVQALNPVNFEWIAGGTRVDGFLAHEAQEVVPEAVSGTKDAMRDEEYEVTPAVLDDDGNVVTEAVMGTRSVPDYQGIDQSKLVPLLTAALQEALTKIDALETRITALEG